MNYDNDSQGICNEGRSDQIQAQGGSSKTELEAGTGERKTRQAEKASYYQRNKSWIKEHRRAYCKANREKIKQSQKKYYALHRWGWRKYGMKSVYGITEAQFNAMLKSQNGCCAICGSQSTNHKRHKNFSIDHDHKTGTVRGLLCHKCNQLLGHARDSISILSSAIVYLTNAQTKTNPTHKGKEKCLQ